MSTSDLISYVASNLVLLTFMTKDMRRLRSIAILSNIDRAILYNWPPAIIRPLLACVIVVADQQRKD